MNFSEAEVITFFESLVQNNVQFLIVGGLAVNFHGFSRATADIDVWLKDNSTNRKNFVTALKQNNITGADIFSSLPFVAGYTEVVLDSGFHIDLMSELQFFGQDRFDECYDLAVDISLSENVKIKVLHVNALIAEKEKSNRPKDRMDAEELKKLYQK